MESRGLDKIAFISVLKDAEEGEKVQKKSKYIFENGENNIIVKDSLEIGVTFDHDSDLIEFNLMNGRPILMFLYDKKNERKFRIDYKLDTNDSTKALKSDKHTVWQNDRVIRQNDANRVPLPEIVPDEIDLLSTLEMLVFGKRPITNQPVDADMLASAETMVVPWSETHSL